MNYASGLENKYDFTIMQHMPDMSEFEFVELMQDEIVVITATDSKLAEYDEVSLEQIKDMKYIALYSAGSYNEHGFDTRIYRLHDAEQLIGDIYDMLYGID